MESELGNTDPVDGNLSKKLNSHSAKDNSIEIKFDVTSSRNSFVTLPAVHKLEKDAQHTAVNIKNEFQ